MRELIVSAAKMYSCDLAGKTFLYVFRDEYFEVQFPVDRFLHLTGVDTMLKARDFYQKAKAGKLGTNQFSFSSDHSFGAAKKKLPCLNRLPELTNTCVCVVKNLKTVSVIYTLGVTNLEFTLGLTENLDPAGKRINDYYLPRTLRVKDKAIDMSTNGDFVDFIFAKSASISLYDSLSYADPSKKMPETIRELVSANLFR